MKANRDQSILVLGDQTASSSSLAERVRRLGYRTVRAKTPADAVAIAEERRMRFAIALIQPSLAVMDLLGALREIRRAADSERCVFIAAGEAPIDEDRQRLRRAGVEMALWEPVGDHALLFQLNRALGDRRVELLRGQERVPTDAAARVFVGGREKPVQIYSLSCGGGYLATNRPSQAGVEIAVEMNLPGGPVTLPARVIYTNVPGNLQHSRLPDGMGVRFVEVSAAESRLLHDCVEQSASQFVV